MAISEIEKLERRYAENPQGLTFAPLAEVHRKSGDVARALELLRPGLALHPDYIPASIVLGRCHLDLGDLQSGEAAFAHVLSLDAENVIALKALADITERLLRLEESERWLRTLLTVDRSNDEARDQLARVEAARQQAEIASAAAPAAEEAESVSDEDAETSAPPPASMSGAGTIDDAPAAESGVRAPTDVTPAAYAPEPPPPPAFGWSPGPDLARPEEPPPLDFEELDSDVLDSEELDVEVTEVAAPEGIELDHPVRLDTPVEPLAGLVGRDEEPMEAEHLALEGEIEVETAEDIVLESAGGSEFQVANASEELGARVSPDAPERDPSAASLLEPELPPLARQAAEAAGSAEVVEAATSPVSESSGAAEPEPRPEPVAATVAPPPPTWVPPIADPGRPVAPDLMLTESMAELLLQQGHAAEALRVYRDLESRPGADARLRMRVAELERALRPETPAVPATISAPESAGGEQTPGDTPPLASGSYSVQATHGQSVGAFLREMLATRPRPAGPRPVAHTDAARGDSGSEGAPTRPAQDNLSLSSVFGEESAPTQPAVPSSGQGGGSTTGGVSYDEFFGTSGGSAPRSPRAPDAKSDDLDQFHTWLQNLKR
jgi:tetratricopeptide (TPR) repeat protein